MTISTECPVSFW